MAYYTGIDVSLRSVSICVVDDRGEVCLEAKVAAEVDAIVDRLRRFSSDVKAVGFEAGTLTQYLTYGLQAAGLEVICLEARQVSVTLAAMRNKTDRNDARGLAQILRTGWYNRVHVKSLHSHQVRALLASRKAILTKCVDLENELRGLLKVFGIRLPSRVGHGSFDAELRDRVTGEEMLACALVPLLDLDGALQDVPEARQRRQGAGACRSGLSPLDVHAWRRPGHRIDVQGCCRRPEPLQVLAHGGCALRPDPTALPVGRARQPRPHLQGRRRRCSLGALRRGSLAANAQRPVVDLEGLGSGPCQDPWPPPRCGCRGPQAGRDPASHVDRRVGVPLGPGASLRMISSVLKSES